MSGGVGSGVGCVKCRKRRTKHESGKLYCGRHREAALKASVAFEAKWTWQALRKAIPGLAQRLREQIEIFDEACITGTPREIVEHGQATVRG